MILAPCQPIQVKKCPAFPVELLVNSQVNRHTSAILKKAHANIAHLVNDANSVIERYQVFQKTNDVNMVELMNLAEEYNETAYESSSSRSKAVAFLNETADLDTSPDVRQARNVAHYIVDTCAKIDDSARVFTMWTLV